MPVDPRTGQQLPYPGEPGYEEAMAANPEAYQGEAFPPGGELPPAGPGAELSPEQAGAPTPEDITDLEDEQAQLTQDIMTEAAPQPEKPYSVKAIGTLIDEFFWWEGRLSHLRGVPSVRRGRRSGCCMCWNASPPAGRPGV